MTQKNFTIHTSLESRNTALFVQVASKYKSHIQLRLDHKIVNAKSIMGLVSLGVLDGQNITLMADGTDAEQAIVELYNFFMAVV